MEANNKRNIVEKEVKAGNGMAALIICTVLLLASCFLLVNGAIVLENGGSTASGVVSLVAGIVYLCIGWIPYMGLKIIKPNEALVMTLFGKYYGTIKSEGFYFVNPFVSSVNPAADNTGATSAAIEQPKQALAITPGGIQGQVTFPKNKKVSLKVTTINNEKQKINDQLGNPIIIGIVVVWKVVNPTMAVFNVDNYKEYLSIQCDSALRNIVRLYPYDIYGDDNEKTLRGSSQEISVKLREEIQAKAEMAGIEIQEARITQLSYAPEIAAAMLQRQQASAIIDARQMIVEGAVGMVEMALAKLSARDIVNLDDERKAVMVSNLMVVLCGNKDAQPVINSGTLY